MWILGKIRNDVAKGFNQVLCRLFRHEMRIRKYPKSDVISIWVAHQLQYSANATRIVEPFDLGRNSPKYISGVTKMF